MRKWNIPLTYQPKIEPVRRGDCHQTIRPGRKFSVGDLVRFYIWSGKPYRSKRETITEYLPLTTVLDMGIHGDIVWIEDPSMGVVKFFGEISKKGRWYSWEDLDWLAELDYIIPPTGETLLNVLIQKNGKIPDKGIDMQIIRW